MIGTNPSTSATPVPPQSAAIPIAPLRTGPTTGTTGHSTSSSSYTGNNNGSSPGSTPTQVHTCGSLFAKCSCASTTIAGCSAPTDTGDAVHRRKTLFQSYSHPDTNFVFTDENRNPQRAAAARIARNQSTVTRTKRMSTPCAPGTYSVLNVAVHPDLMLAMSHQNGRIEPISTETVATALGRAPRASVLKKSSTTAAPVAQRVASPAAAADRNTPVYGAVGSQQIAEDECTSSSDERRDSFRTMEPQQPIGGYNRRQSRSLGDPSRVEQVCVPTVGEWNHGDRYSPICRQLRQYAMRKQSECNESEYIRAQRQRTLDLEAETARLKQTISDRDNEIHKLKREIHKLKVRTAGAHSDIFQRYNGSFVCVVWCGPFVWPRDSDLCICVYDVMSVGRVRVAATSRVRASTRRALYVFS